MNTLKIHIGDPWFSMIASGEMKEAYKEMVPSWRERLYEDKGVLLAKTYDNIMFVSSSGTKRWVLTEFGGTSIGRPKAAWSPERYWDEPIYVIGIGNILEVKL